MTNDILIIGGGIIGLAIAIDLKLRGANKVTVLSRDFRQAASHAAAGMLAPHAERIASRPMLELCLGSRWLYPEWIRKLEELTGLETGYFPCGILAPVYDLPQTEIQSDYTATWLDKEAIQLYQPGLGADVVGGWWYPEDGQVDNRILVNALLQTAQALKVDLREGISVQAIQQKQGKVHSILTSQGELQAQTYVLATGSWATQLLPLPVRPVKGQMLSLRMPREPHQSLPLQRVLFGSDIYLVPRQDGRLIVGATVEEVSWTPQNTPKGIQTLLQKAIRLYPVLEDWAIEELWWGFRPGTPDELPILGTSSCDNLILAVGHYRNGILLAPVTASLISDLILQQKADPLLDHFRWDRFYKQDLRSRVNFAPPAPQFWGEPIQSPPSLGSQSGLGSSRQGGTGVDLGGKCVSFDKKYVVTNTLPMHITHVNGSSPHRELEAKPTATLLPEKDELIIAGRKFHSRLMTGTGKYPNLQVMQQSIVASGCQIVTVAVRRVQTQAPGHEGLAEAIDWTKIWMLPNTAGCKTAEEAIRVARLGREMAKLLGQEDNNFVKLEVIPDLKYLLPDPIGTLQAAEQLVKEGFAVLPYINADPLLAKRLEEVGCATVMPLGSPIGSGQGIKNAANIAIIIEEAKIPVVVDAGIGAPSEAAQAMEMGADALLINSAIALAANPAMMGQAMGMAAEAGRLAYLAGRMPLKSYASASSPLTGTIS